MTRSMDRYDLALRQEVRRQLVASGVPETHADQVVDLGFHAADTACARLQEIAFSAEDERISITALGVAISVALSRLATMQEAMIAAGAESGRPIRHFTVGGDHG